MWKAFKIHYVFHSLIRTVRATAVDNSQLVRVEPTENISSRRDSRLRNYDNNTIVDFAAVNKGNLEDAGIHKLATDGHVSASLLVLGKG
jgi:hypothetical protein